MAPPAVVMRNITKTFPGLYLSVVANRQVDLTVEQGEIHVIVGENGAGKSTLMNILYGLLQPDGGEVLVFGQRVDITSPKVAIDLGIGMIHQHFMLVPSFSVGENIVLGQEPTRALLLDRRTIRQVVKDLSEGLKLVVDPDVPVWDTSVGVQQRVEILKALYRGARILILDEPTAVLTPQEVEVLFNALRKLAAGGTTIIMITHKLPEVMIIADRVTVMRDGAVVGRVERSDLDERHLAELMTGRTLTQESLPRVQSAAPPVLEISDLYGLDDRGLPAVRGVSFALQAGEILGIAGVSHNGQEELAEVIAGQRALQAGKIYFCGQDITGYSVRSIRELGIGHIPDDRYGEGCAREASLSRNLIMAAHNTYPLGGRALINLKQTRLWTDRLIAEYDIKADHPDMPMMSLSGGNVQKAIVAREMSLARRCLIAEQPSRGIDIGAAEFIYQKLQALRDQGVGILLISMDLSEVVRLSDRVLVMFGGRIVGERRPEETTQEELGLMMAGVKRD